MAKAYSAAMPLSEVDERLEALEQRVAKLEETT
jgi:polyhydroxyalkanoate synthesis regulator phasin